MNLTTGVSPVTFYCYLKHKFGDPNGFAMQFRHPSVDNIIHWNYTLKYDNIIIDIKGLDLTTSVLFDGINTITGQDKSTVENSISEEFKLHQKEIKAVQDSLEKWIVLPNPYHYLRTAIQENLKLLSELNLESPMRQTDIQSEAEIQKYIEELNKHSQRCTEGLTLCMSTHVMTPVLAEAALNLVISLLAKPEVRQDKRTFENYKRSNIDTRIKTLHLHCEKVDKRVTGSEDPFRDLLRLMNRRNNTLHGNIEVRESSGSTIWFDDGTIPLTDSYNSLGNNSLQRSFALIDPEKVRNDFNIVERFVTFLLDRLESDCQKILRRFLEKPQIGFCPEKGIFGDILPQANLEFIQKKVQDDKSYDE